LSAAVEALVVCATASMACRKLPDMAAPPKLFNTLRRNLFIVITPLKTHYTSADTAHAADALC
jgi:hypothetical protein